MSQENVEIADRAMIDTATIIDLRDGRIARLQGYMNPTEALAAVGLSE